jgi:hypothetical protein
MLLPLLRRDEVHGNVEGADDAAHVAVGAAEVEHRHAAVAWHGADRSITASVGRWILISRASS